MNQSSHKTAVFKKCQFPETTKAKEVRRPGLEPGFRRWQRLVITTTLSAQCALQCGNSNDLSISKRGTPDSVFSGESRIFRGTRCTGDRTKSPRYPDTGCRVRNSPADQNQVQVCRILLNCVLHELLNPCPVNRTCPPADGPRPSCTSPSKEFLNKNDRVF